MGGQDRTEGGPNRHTRRGFISAPGGAAAALSVPGLLAACGTTQPLPAPGGVSGPDPRPGPRGAATGAAERAGVAADLRGQQGDRLGPEAREGAAAVLQLAGVHQPGRHQLVREEVRRRGPDLDVHHARRGGGQDRVGRRAVRRLLSRDADLEQLVVGKLLRAAEPRLHPQPRGQRLADARQPLVRLRQPVHGPVHDLHDRHRLAHRQAAELQPRALRQPVERAVDRGPEDLRAGRDARRPARRAGARAAAQRRHRRQHREPGHAERRPEVDPAAGLRAPT